MWHKREKWEQSEKDGEKNREGNDSVFSLHAAG